MKNQAGTALAQYAYDARSRRTALAYANGAGMEYAYDTANRLLALDNFTASGDYLYEYSYDKVGNRTTMAVTDGGGTRMHVYSYDDIYQITEVNYPSGYDYLATDTAFNYDAAGNRTSVIDAGGTSSYVTNALNQYTAVGGVSYDYDDNGNLTQDEKFQYAYDPENRLTGATKLAGTPDPLTAACDTTLVFTTGGAANWFRQTTTYHDGGDAAQSGDIGDSQESWLETTFEGEGTLTFYWKVSSESGSDYLQLFIDGSYDTSISGSQSWQQVSRNIVGLGPHTIRWVYDKDETGTSGSDCGWVDNVQWTPASNPPVAALAAAVDHASLDFITGGDADWSDTTLQPYYDGDCARSGYLGDDEFSEMQTEVSGSGTLTFYWKVSSEESYDWLEVYLDGVRQDRISGDVSWTQKSLNISGAGNHTLLWRYVKDGSGAEGDDRGYVDYVQWSGAGPIAAPPSWQTVSYTYDPAGRRIEKKVDGTTEVKFVYDGDHIIAEYDASNALLRKYVHGPCTDEPICLIEASGTYAGTHYYHYDALGSIVAMTNSSGTAVQLYEYSVYGQVAASDANHPNRFLFTGREFDQDTGLYYYRARYYNPEIGRFLQTDPIGYGDGINWYRYCGNGPTNAVDPTGRYDLCFMNGAWEYDWQNVEDSLVRVREACVHAIGEIDMVLSDVDMQLGCGGHEPASCPLIPQLTYLREVLAKVVDGIDSSEQLGIAFIEAPLGTVAAYAPIGVRPYFVENGVVYGDPNSEPVTIPTVVLSQQIFQGICYLGDQKSPTSLWEWDVTLLHELAAHYGVPDTEQLSAEGLSPFGNGITFYETGGIDDVARCYHLWGCDAWTYVRESDCYRICTCGPTTRNLNCPRHGRGRAPTF